MRLAQCRSSRARNLANAKVWYDWALSAEAQSHMKEAKSFQLPSNRSAEISEYAPRFENIKLIDYDFKTYGDSAKRKALLSRWDKDRRQRAVMPHRRTLPLTAACRFRQR